MSKNKSKILLLIFLFLPALAQPSLSSIDKNNQFANSQENAQEKGFRENEAIVKLRPKTNPKEFAKEEGLVITPLDSDNSNFKYKMLRLPNDRRFSLQWYFKNDGAGIWTESAWDLEGIKQSDIVVAVIDTGVNYKHKDLKKNIAKGKAKGKNFRRTNKKPHDRNGHGTLISGVIAGRTNNRRGVSGTSYRNHLRIMPLKFNFTTAQAVMAVNHARQKSVPVINASWGGYGAGSYDPALKDAISQFPGVFVAAAGNNGINHDSGDSGSKMYPCDFDLTNIICVGASGKNGELAHYSDYGISSVDVIAPGGDASGGVLGLSRRKSRYTYAMGSSVSAAFVAAEAGLILSKYPHLSREQVIEIILNSVDKKESLFGKIRSEGKINLRRALELAGTY